METLSATEPLRIDDVVLIPVQRVRIVPSQGCDGMSILASAVPRAIIIEEGGHWRAIDLDGAEIALEPLLEHVVGLAEAVQQQTRLRRSST